MVIEVPLAHIEAIIGAYTDQGEKPLVLYPWVKERLSLFSRFVGFFGGVNRPSWREKYLTPILLEASIPHLQRFFKGNWRVNEEQRLKVIFDFFSARIDTCRNSLEPHLITFLMGPTPSFFQEKARAQAFLKEGAIQWRRDETYSEYKKRLQSMQEKGRPIKEALPRTAGIKEEALVFEPLTKKTKEHLDKTLERLHSIREECIDTSFQLEKDFSKLFPLRYDFESLVTSLKQKQEALFTLILTLENEIAKFSEMHVIAEEERASLLLEDVDALLENLAAQGRRIKESLLESRSQTEEARSILYKQLQQITRAIDSVNLLPAESAFKEQQARIIRMARDKVKKFKESLSRGPGPGFPFAALEKDVELSIHLAKDFFKEGMEVMSMHEQLSSHIQQVENLVAKESGSKKAKLLSLLADMKELQKTLEVSPDRQAYFDKVLRTCKEVLK